MLHFGYIQNRLVFSMHFYMIRPVFIVLYQLQVEQKKKKNFDVAKGRVKIGWPHIIVFIEL